MPLSTLTWEDAIKYMVLDKADVLLYHDNWVVHSAHWETQVPSVMMLREYMKPKTAIRFSKSNIFLRDRYRCAYCNTQLEKKECTLDHVLPTSHGGKTTFENCVTACGPCNAGKGNDKKIRPKFKPYKPEYFELISKRKEQGLQVKYDEWLQFIT
jgi:5-methylcytosine-specific restriction endonuclease McrA